MSKKGPYNDKDITCVLFLTLIISTESGPVLNSSSSFLTTCKNNFW